MDKFIDSFNPENVNLFICYRHNNSFTSWTNSQSEVNNCLKNWSPFHQISQTCFAILETFLDIIFFFLKDSWQTNDVHENLLINFLYDNIDLLINLSPLYNYKIIKIIGLMKIRNFEEAEKILKFLVFRLKTVGSFKSCIYEQTSILSTIVQLIKNVKKENYKLMIQISILVKTWIYNMSSNSSKNAVHYFVLASTNGKIQLLMKFFKSSCSKINSFG